MLVCFGLFGLLLYNTVVANVCSFTYSHKDEIRALSQHYQQKGYRQCEFHIRAPRNNFIELNFTRFFGFRSQSSMTTGNLRTEHTEDHSSDECLPPEVVLKEKNSSEEDLGRICKNTYNLGSPKVFHSKLNVVKITYIWLQNHSSGFTVEFDFHHYNSSCVHICDDRVCLSDVQLCNGKFECADQSDEQNCPPLFQSTGASQSSTTNVDLIKAFAVIISIVLMPGLFIIICVVSPCPLRSRMWRRRRRSRERLEHSQLRPESQVSEVVYVPVSTPSTSQDKLLEHQISQVHEHQVRVRSVQTDTMLDLPPQIPISKDGEEGYIESQKHLIRSRYIDQLFRPPPNKTVHDRESPPPYYSNSASLENLGKPPTRIVRDSNGCPRMLRCYSMSSNVSNSSSANGHKDVQKKTITKSHNRTLSTNSAGRKTRTVSDSVSPNEQTDEPPDYMGVCSSDNNKVSPQMDSNV
ncbi:uncharacterized protein LOC123550626 isoform X2 [Mercenaria mercenaria]|uniref:uncharacterized protein LOC123550626 isoform X2 n=1 Tax=Mercenaria mercenaria TaxID=6596 RepID=UPI00234E8CBC|nr:uncharacterized protein LOC123550626 isoform X2 [Mercenaria mercenaria]